MTPKFTRRGFVAASAAALAGCTTVEGSAQRAQVIDQRVDAALFFLENESSSASDLSRKASGILVMPLVTEAGFGFGGSYGTGALRINGATVDYYNAAQASFGVQIGAQQYAHALYFMTPDALNSFRSGPGLTVGGDLKVTMLDRAEELTAGTITTLDPVIGIEFGQAGFIFGGSLEGTKYTRILP